MVEGGKKKEKEERVSLFFFLSFVSFSNSLSLSPHNSLSLSPHNSLSPQLLSPATAARSLPVTIPSLAVMHWNAKPQTKARATNQSSEYPTWAPAWMSASKFPGSR